MIIFVCRRFLFVFDDLGNRSIFCKGNGPASSQPRRGSLPSQQLPPAEVHAVALSVGRQAAPGAGQQDGGVPRRSGQGTDRLHSNEPGTYADSIHHIEGFLYILQYYIYYIILYILYLTVL